MCNVDVVPLDANCVTISDLSLADEGNVTLLVDPITGEVPTVATVNGLNTRATGRGWGWDPAAAG